MLLKEIPSQLYLVPALANIKPDTLWQGTCTSGILIKLININ